MPVALRQHKPSGVRPHRVPKQDNPERTLRLNTVAWKRLRAEVLTREPLCRLCLLTEGDQPGQVVEATDVDHWDNNPANNDPTNLVPLCHSHHSRKTRAWQLEKSRGTAAATPRGEPCAHGREI